MVSYSVAQNFLIYQILKLYFHHCILEVSIREEGLEGRVGLLLAELPHRMDQEQCLSPKLPSLLVPRPLVSILFNLHMISIKISFS